MGPLATKQAEFAIAHAKWIVWVYEQGWRITKSEGYVGDTDARDGDHDGPHMRGGNHYTRLAEDDNLWALRDGVWTLLSRGDEPEWSWAGAKWLTMHPSARWGGNFSRPDANHISFEHEGRQ